MKRTTIVGTLTLLALIGGSYAAYRRHHPLDPFPRFPQPPDENVQAAADRNVLERPLQVLNDSRRDEGEVIAALTRVGSRSEPVARTAALAVFRQPSQRVRQAAAEVLGRFGDAEARAAWRELAGDVEANVRLAALRSIGYGAEPWRLEELRRLMARIGRPEERVQAQATLWQLTRDPEERARLVTDLLATARESAPEVATPAALTLVRIAGKDPRVQAFHREVLQKKLNPRIAPVSLRQLAIARDSWLDRQLEGFISGGSPELALTAVQVIPILCPADATRLSALAIERSEPGTSLRAAAIETAAELREGALVEPLKKIGAETRTPIQERRDITRALLLIRTASKPADRPCSAESVRGG